MTPVVLLLHAFATVAMTGLIWFVQVVHYPLFARVGRDDFTAYEREHVRRTGIIVLPLMLLELATALTWLATEPATPLAWVGMVLLGVIWGSTFLVQVPCHRRLERGFDPRSAARLVRSNWIRTVAWSMRAAVALLALAPIRSTMP